VPAAILRRSSRTITGAVPGGHGFPNVIVAGSVLCRAQSGTAGHNKNAMLANSRIGFWFFSGFSIFVV
jgi:hypothetical protein